MVDTLLIVSILGVIVFAYYFYDSYRRKKRAKELGKVLKILLFEQVGKDKVYRGERKGFEKFDEEIGVYILIGKEKKTISDVDHNDLFFDDKDGKCLLVCKYADDDYRAMSRLNKESWFKKVLVEKPVLGKDGKPKFTEETVINEYGAEVIQKVPVYEKVVEYKSYEEPLAVGNDGREASRFERRFQKRMQDKRREKQGWLEKYAPYITVMLVSVVLLLGFAYGVNKNSETQKYIANTFVEGAESYKKAVENPTYAEKLLDSWEKKRAEEEAPPK